MYNIALCDDETIFLDDLKQTCQTILQDLNIDYVLTTYPSSESFLASKNTFDLILLDIMMGNINGIELAKIIREVNEDVSIIFITSTREYSLQGYDVKALHYLMKPIAYEPLKHLIQTDYERRFYNQFFIFETKTQKIRVDVHEIVCFETVGRKVKVTLLNKCISYKGKLSDFLNNIANHQIVQCHKAYAINLLNIKEIDQQCAIAINGLSIPISRTYMSSVRKAFVKQLQED